MNALRDDVVTKVVQIGGAQGFRPVSCLPSNESASRRGSVDLVRAGSLESLHEVCESHGSSEIENGMDVVRCTSARDESAVELPGLGAHQSDEHGVERRVQQSCAPRSSPDNMDEDQRGRATRHVC